MTPEELLKPRYIMVAIYPDCDRDRLYAGKVIEFSHFDKENNQWYNENDGGKIYDAFYELYPHLFKKLEWWEEREEKDMPEYVKYISSSKIFKPINWSIDPKGTGMAALYNASWYYTPYILPATEEEYNNQNQKI